MNETKNKRDELVEACSSAETMIAYLQEKAANHHNYKIYATDRYLVSWMSSKALFLSNGSTWNDKDDRTRLNPLNAPTVNFGTCFSFSKSENVAMWMLYGGMWNDGIMVDFSHSAMSRIMKTSEVSLGFWYDNQFKVVQSLGKDQFSIELSDVLYCSEPAEVIKRSDTRCNLNDDSLIKALGWHKKVYPWCYENECRMVISIDRNKISDRYFRESDNKWAIKVNVDDIFDEMNKEGRIYRAPNNQNKKYAASKLAARIDWNLCGKECPGKKEQ